MTVYSYALLSTSSSSLRGVGDSMASPTAASAHETPPSAHHDSSKAPAHSQTLLPTDSASPSAEYKTYKRRWFGLAQLTLLNIIISWTWLTYAPVSSTSATFFSTTVPIINWLSTAFLFAFVAAAPFALLALTRGPKTSIVIASVLMLVGNWVRYGGARVGDSGQAFGVTMFGQILCGLAQPFVLSAPTRYSDMWFGERGRIAATAVATLANPLGGALGQLIDPFWATSPDQIPNMVLYVAIISTVATLPSPFLPSHPPTPPTSTSSTNPKPPTLSALSQLFTNASFLVILIPFTALVTAFNAFSSVLNDVLYPYAFSETDAGITGALLIFVGLVASALASPLLDRAPAAHFPTLKVLVIVAAGMYLGFVFAPETRSVAAPFALSAVLGAASFVQLPLALELLVDFAFPLSPEVTSVVAWTGSQLGGAISIIIIDATKGAWAGEPAGNVKGGLVYLAVIVWVVTPLPLLLGWRGIGVRKRSMAVHS